MTSSRLLVLVAGAALLAACGSDDDEASTSTPAATESSSIAPADTTATTDSEPPLPSEPGEVVTGDAASVEAWYEPGDILPELQPFIDLAAADLAERLAVDEDDVAVRAAVLVVWPNSSLGCPEPGVSYMLVQTDGSVIELEHNGLFYRYHSGGQEGPFLCQYPLAESPPATSLDGGSGGDT